MPGTEDLFRRQAVDAQNVMHGRVRIAPPPGWTMTTGIIVGTVLLAIVFASFASYARTVAISGQIETDRGIPTIFAQEPGIVDLRVRLGDNVEQGQVIAETSLLGSDERGNLALRRQRALEEEKAVAQMRAQSATAAGNSQAQAARMRAAAASSRITSLQEQLNQARSRTRTAEADLERARSIAERGFLSRRDLEQRESEVFARRQEESSIEERIAAARGEVASANAEAEQAISRSQVERAEALETITRAEQGEADRSAATKEVHVAPSRGLIASLPVRSGQALRGGETIAVIAPEGAQIVATLRLPTNVMGDVRPGQEVKIAVDSYPYQTFGMLRGTVDSVSRVATEDNGQDVYLVQVDLPDAIIAYGQREPLLPGMTVTARITTQERTLMQWLLDPLYAVARR